MKKIAMAIAMTLAVVTTAHPAAAKQPEKVWRIGYLTPGKNISPAFRQGLRELGYIDGKNLTFEFRRRKWPKTYLDLAKELVNLKVDIILAVGGGATHAAKQATRTIPIVMGNAGDPVQLGLINSLARPGGNVTGVIDLLSNLASKRVGLLKEIFPQLSRIAYISPKLRSLTLPHLKATKIAAHGLGLRVQALNVKGPDDLESAFRAASKAGAEAAIVVGISFFSPHKPQIIKLAAKYRLPTIHTHATWPPLGGLISYSTDPDARYRRAAQYVDKIINGANPADLPVEQAKRFLLTLNLKTARALGITFPTSILLRADRVIE